MFVFCVYQEILVTENLNSGKNSSWVQFIHFSKSLDIPSLIYWTCYICATFSELEALIVRWNRRGHSPAYSHFGNSSHASRDLCPLQLKARSQYDKMSRDITHEDSDSNHELHFLTATDLAQFRDPQTKKKVRSHIQRGRQRNRKQAHHNRKGEFVLDTSMLAPTGSSSSNQANEKLGTALSVPHPSDLGSGRSDPFKRYPIDMSLRNHELFDHCKCKWVNRLRPSSWRVAQCREKIALCSRHWTGLVFFNSCNTKRHFDRLFALHPLTWQDFETSRNKMLKSLHSPGRQLDRWANSLQILCCVLEKKSSFLSLLSRAIVWVLSMSAFRESCADYD